MPSMLILNGPNLNLLGQRQPEVYGRTSLSDVKEACERHGSSIGYDISFEQTNFEGGLVEEIHKARGVHSGIVLNAGAYTHTSIAIMDAVYSAEVPTVEVHLSNVHAREEFRHKSYLVRACVGQIAGFGLHSYLLGMDAIHSHISK